VAYTLGVIRTMVLDAVGEDSVNPSYWTSDHITELDEWIQDAIEEVCVLTGLYVEELRQPLFANRRYYHLDPGKGGELLWLKHLRIEPEGWYLKQSDPTALSRDDVNWMTRTGTPRVWYPVGVNLVRLVPYPASAGQLIEASVVCIPPMATTSDMLLDIPDHLTAAIVSSVVATVLVINRRLEKAAGWLTDYKNALNLADSAMLKGIGRALMPKGLGSSVDI